MQRNDDTIGYAIKVGEAFEVRIVNVRGEQKCVPIAATQELFADLKKICERINAERYAITA